MEAELSSFEKNTSANIQTNAKPEFADCPHCGTVLRRDEAFCPGCGWSMKPLPPYDRAVASAAYLTFVAGALILFLPGFRSHRFVRFHAWQSVLLWGVFSILTMAALLLSNVAAAMVFLLVGILASLAMLFLWVVLSIKAWQGERFELPLFGVLAARLP